MCDIKYQFVLTTDDDSPDATAGLPSSVVAEVVFLCYNKKGTIKLPLLNNEQQPSSAPLDKPDSGTHIPSF